MWTKIGNEIFKISYTGNGPEIDIFVNPSDMSMIWKIILEYLIQYCISYVQDFSILGNFLPARMVGGRVVSYGDC